MGTEKVAKKVLWPKDPKVVLRVCFLYVGQGSSILLLVREGDTYHGLLIDSNLDEKAGGIDLPTMLKDLFDTGELYAYVNTHPHDDHLKGVKEISEAVTVMNVWHSGHAPSKDNGEYHPDLTKLIKDVKGRGGQEVELSGSNKEQALFDASMFHLAPAEHVKEEVNDEDSETRYRRIHENCAVLRFGKDPSWVLVTGDADLKAFKDHITDYHKDRLPSLVLDASHHGSRSFFKDNEEDDPYLTALEAIDPSYVVVSAPTVEESRHDHPHKDAMKIYEDHVGAANVFHLGEDRCSVIVDIFEDGSGGKPVTDNGDLAQHYGLDKDDDGKGGTEKAQGPFIKPAAPAQGEPRKYA